MPTTSTSTSTSVTSSSGSSRELMSRLASGDPEIKFKALREIKNQIIGNRTKKLYFLKLGAVPTVSGILYRAQVELPDDNIYSKNDSNRDIIIQSAAVLGSFACGFDAGVRAVIDASAFPQLVRLLGYRDDKVVDAGARSLKMIYQSNLAPKYDFLQEKNMEFLLSLLHSESENVTGLGASIITHSCQSIAEQKALCDAGVLEKLVGLLEGSLSQRDASLESLAMLFKDNPDVVLKFAGLENGRPLSSITELTKDRHPRTRLLACICLISIRNTSPCYLQDVGIKTRLVNLLLELLDTPDQVGDDASFAFSSLIAQKEDLQKLAFEANAVDKLFNLLQGEQLHSKRLQGLLLALGNLCSKLESCRSRFLSLQVLELVIDSLTNDNADIRSAACICLRNVSRSIKNLCAGYFMNEKIIIPLVQLLDDSSVSVQVAALGAVSNIMVDLATRKSTFIQCGGIKQLVQLSKSMESTVRSNALWALRNMMFLADDKCKEGIFLELSASEIASLICDPEPLVQEQALALVRNLVDGCVNSVEFVFAEDGVILDAVGRQVQSASKAEIGIQGMYLLSNIASGNEFHKEAVIEKLLPQVDKEADCFIINFLRSNDSRLRTAAVWAIVNLTFPSSPGAFGRLIKLRNAGIVSQIKSMVNDSCQDVKLRVRTVLTQSMAFGDGT
ncbi:armadillo repeat-containing protein 8 isoform X1 [Tripterygium wilfordii]|uniref:armadillo repeat-containing protein 8 isoform X1 n=1 Tax=Tripterygium wilfordii TaxID=458696 RepID=UPI0018F7FFA1|nr:armadillo repeat-containing protein 8 isoform X1 [Tripterygium wilfordii]